MEYSEVTASPLIKLNTDNCTSITGSVASNSSGCILITYGGFECILTVLHACDIDWSLNLMNYAKQMFIEVYIKSAMLFCPNFT